MAFPQRWLISVLDRFFEAGRRHGTGLEGRRFRDRTDTNFSRCGIGPLRTDAKSPRRRERFGFNQIVTTIGAELQNLKPEMSTVKAALLSLAMLSAIVMCGFGIYAADASSGHAVVDGYGVIAAQH